MNHKLNKPLVSNFRATDPRIAYLSLASEAFIMNKGSMIGTPRGKKISKDTRVS